MSFYRLKSNAKINLSLNVLGKKKNKLHRIETLVTFASLHDEILIKCINKKNHLVNFSGRFSKNITKKNTITKLLEILDKKKLLKNKKYFIRVKKNIPQMSGMGGGSMNAATIINYLIHKHKIKISLNEKYEICKKIGSDVILGLDKKISVFNGNKKIFKFKNKIKLNLIIVKPNFGCSTKFIYKKIKSYSKPVFTNYPKSMLDVSNLINLKNDLELVAFKKYPILLNIKKNLLKLPGIEFARMTGSGSSIVGFFITKKTALNGMKKIKKKYKNYWCILSRTI